MADLTDGQWDRVRPLVEWNQKRRPDGRGGRWRDARQVLNGVLWILRTGAPWQDLPPRYGPYQTCHRRFQQWQRGGVLDGILWALCEDLLARGELGLDETFIDASFVGAKRGAIALVQRAAAKGVRSWQSPTARVFLAPYGLRVLRRMSQSWSKKRAQRHVAAVPERLIGDRGYDSDPLDERLRREQGIELIAVWIRHSCAAGRGCTENVFSVLRSGLESPSASCLV